MRKITIPAILAVVAVCLSFSAVVWAQSTTDGAIGGTVLDQSGLGIPTATVTVHNNGTNVEQTVAADASGYYRVMSLQPAVYTVTVGAPGFRNFRAEQVIVQIGAVTELSPRLAVGGTEETVIVSSESPQINLTSADFAPTLDQTAISNLPIQRPRWSNFSLLTPGVVNDSNGFGLLSFRGISTLLNNNTVDGADNNQAFFSEERGRTRASYSSAAVAIQEFQVNTSNYSAEYGRSAGGVVNTVTKSGTNEFHGELYYKDRNNTRASRNPFTTITTQTSPGVYTTVPYKPTDWWKIWGFGVGGPIVRDKLFFFLAYDGFKRNFPGTGVASSPAAFFATPTAAQVSTLASNLKVSNAQAQAYYTDGLNGLLSMLGSTPRTGEQNILFPKLDWVINHKNRASFAVNRMRWASPAGIQTQSTNTYGIRSFGNDYVADTWGIGKLDSFITNRLSNQVRFQYGRDFEWENNQTPTDYEQSNLVKTSKYTNPLGLPPYVFITNGFGFGTATFLNRAKYPDERRSQFADTLVWSHGNHIFKFGGDFSHVSESLLNLSSQFGYFSYSSLVNYFSDFYATNGLGCTSSGKAVPCYSSFTQAFGPIGFDFNTDDIALFVQDDWRVVPRLSLSMGLRWEKQLLPDPILPNPAIPQTSVLPSGKNSFGPRIGFAWDMFGDGKTSLRGGYGIYYGRIVNSNVYGALTQTGVAGSQLSYSFTATQGGPAFPQILASSGSATIKPAVIYYDPGYKNPQIHQVDLMLERNLGWNTVLSVAYLGSFGRFLAQYVDSNLNPSTSAITYKVSGGGPVTAATYTTPLFTSRPNTSYGAMIKIFGTNSSYNAMAIQVSHRLSRGLQFSANYTWSHALDYGQTPNTTLTASSSSNMLLPFDVRPEYGNSQFNVPSRFTLSMVINSPWHMHGWVRYLTDDWQMAPIFQAQNGLPYSLSTTGSAPGGVSGGVNGSGGRYGIDLIGRSSFKQPGQQNMDLRLSKKFSYRERYHLELMGEAFNLFNHFNATGVSTTGYVIGGTAAAPTLTYNAPFGSVTSANSNFAYSTRQIQLAIRFLF